MKWWGHSNPSLIKEVGLPLFEFEQIITFNIVVAKASGTTGEPDLVANAFAKYADYIQ